MESIRARGQALLPADMNDMLNGPAMPGSNPGSPSVNDPATDPATPDSNFGQPILPDPGQDSNVGQPISNDPVTEPVQDPVQNPGQDLSDLAVESLSIHNYFRSLHGVPDLRWDTEIEKTAQEWADGCRIPQIHSGTPGVGENLARGFPTITAAIEAMYYNEEPKHDYANPQPGAGTGHFTQIVWKDTKFLACANGNCPHLNGGYWVCQYGPPGNYRNRMTEQVLPPL